MRTLCLIALGLAVSACSSPQAPGPVELPSPNVHPQMSADARFGADVCDTLVQGLAADTRGEPIDVSLYATERVLRALYADNPFAQPGAEPGDIAAWTDDEEMPVETCNISAGGDAWYELTLSPRTDDDPMYQTGQWATGLDMKTSYD